MFSVDNADFRTTAAEPRFQLRSLIQNDGTLLHVRLDTETGKTWRLERVLKNRIEISSRQLAARELERTRIDVKSLESFTLAEVLQTLNGILTETGNDNLPRLVFSIPVKNPDIDQAKAKEQLCHRRNRLEKPRKSSTSPGPPLLPGFPPGAIPGNPNAPPSKLTRLPAGPYFDRPCRARRYGSRPAARRMSPHFESGTGGSLMRNLRKTGAGACVELRRFAVAVCGG